jgi:hypothetical protein
MRQLKKLFITLSALTLVFSSSCDNNDEESISYPETGFYGDNILFQSKTDFNKRENSLQCKLSKNQKVKIKITGQSVPSAIWYYDPGTINNWALSNMDKTNYSQTFTSIDAGLTCDVKMMFDRIF